MLSGECQHRLRAELPALLQAWERVAPGRPAVAKGRLPLGLALACADLGAQVTAVQARIATIEQALTPLAERLPAYPLLRTIPGIGPTVAAILLAEIGDIAWFTKFSQLRKLAGLDIVRVQSGQFAGQARISKCGRSLLRWALYHAAMGTARTVAGRARLAVLKAKRHGDRSAGFKAIVELAAKVLRVVWGVWRSGTSYDPLRTGGLRRQPR
jgi:transposase